MQVSLSAALQALPSADAIVAVAEPVQPEALAAVAFVFEQQPALAVFADASVALASVQVEAVFDDAEHPGPACATDALNIEVRQQSEPQNWPDISDPAATRNSAATKTIVALLAFFNPMHSSVSGYMMLDVFSSCYTTNLISFETQASIGCHCPHEYPDAILSTNKLPYKWRVSTLLRQIRWLSPAEVSQVR